MISYQTSAAAGMFTAVTVNAAGLGLPQAMTAIKTTATAPNMIRFTFIIVLTLKCDFGLSAC
ncbi:MAG TPA: hypothetical protein DHW65_01440 [Dehalococcoidia bacterium]|nr:hypothetical protein [Dehalococcoidia bacterium]HCP23996.1 hypothetical protein [Dehalococcoidia bacterium]